MNGGEYRNECWFGRGGNIGFQEYGEIIASPKDGTCIAVPIQSPSYQKEVLSVCEDDISSDRLYLIDIRDTWLPTGGLGGIVNHPHFGQSVEESGNLSQASDRLDGSDLRAAVGRMVGRNHYGYGIWIPERKNNMIT
jgi:hypothetical protein